MSILESRFQAKVIRELHETFPGIIVLKNDPNYLQGFPDLTLLYHNYWSVLETKRLEDSDRQNNQEYYVKELSKWSYTNFIYPENKETVLDELQYAFRLKRSTRILRR
jgi:hypothetical protein